MRAARLDVGRPSSSPCSQGGEDPFERAAPSYDAVANTVTIDPFGCAPVVVELVPPEGFEFDATADAAKWSRFHGTRDWMAIREEKAWLDFITLDASCTDRHDGAQRQATNVKKVHVDDQSVHPFEASHDPAVRAMRQRFEILTANLDASSPVLEYRNTFPDGVPVGFVYDQYEGLRLAQLFPNPICLINRSIGTSCFSVGASLEAGDDSENGLHVPGRWPVRGGR